MGKKLSELDEDTTLTATDLLHIRGLDGIDKRITAANAILDLIAAQHQSIDGGYINTNDWTNRHLGSANITYDNLAGSFIVGEIVTEAISGNTGVVMSDSGTILVLRAVTGTGVFTNDREITGTDSGATADVDGNTKNVDTNFYHGFGMPLSKLLVEALVSTDGTDANSFELLDSAWGAGASYGIILYAIDNNNIKIQTGAAGITRLNDAGSANVIDTEDWYYKIKVYLMG